MTRGAGIVAVVFLLMGPTVVWARGDRSPAKSDGAREEARAHFKKAIAHYMLNHYQEAIVEFEAGFAADPQPGFLFNLAQTHAKLGHKRQALDFYQKYLDMGAPVDDVPMVKMLISQLERELQQPLPTPAASAPVASASPTVVVASTAPPSEPTRAPEPARPPAPAAVPAPPAAQPTTAPAAAAIVAPSVVASPPPKRRVWPIAVGVIAGVVVVGAAVGLGVGVSGRRDPSLLWDAR